MREMTYRDAIRETLRDALRQDERVFLMGEDIGAYGGAYAVTKGLLDEFGERRVKDTPIAESVLAGAGVGAAAAGLRPVVEMMSINSPCSPQIRSSTTQPNCSTCPVVRFCALDHPHGQRRWQSARCYSFPKSGRLVCSGAGVKGCDPRHPLRRPGPFEKRLQGQ